MSVALRKDGEAVRIYLLWALMAVPAIVMLVHDITHKQRANYLGWTGEISCWFLIATLAVTPLKSLFGRPAWMRALIANRRYLGMASFYYALLHLAYFLKYTTPLRFLETFIRPEVITGWIAFFVMIPLAWTSTDAAVQRMGPRWRRLHQWTYFCALFSLLHWAQTTPAEGWALIAAYVLPLLLLWTLAIPLSRRRA